MIRFLILTLIIVSAGNFCFGQPSPITKTSSGLQYQIQKAGQGISPQLDDVVSFYYIFKLENGRELDNSYSRNRPMETKVSELIRGLCEGFQLMSKGSKFSFIIPAELAYGSRGGGGGQVPPNVTVLYDIELVDVQPAEKLTEDSSVVGFLELLELQHDYENVQLEHGEFNSKLPEITDKNVQLSMMKTLYEVYRLAALKLINVKKRNVNFSEKQLEDITHYDAYYEERMMKLTDLMVKKGAKIKN